MQAFQSHPFQRELDCSIIFQLPVVVSIVDIFCHSKVTNFYDPITVDPITQDTVASYIAIYIVYMQLRAAKSL